MKKLLMTLLAACALPMVLMAQSADDDLYFVPSKKKVEKKENPVRVETPATVVVETPSPTVVVRDKKKRVRDVDAYNRRYDASDYTFASDNDTIYIDERADSDLRGEWVNGFDGSVDDYEYATRIIRFRNPRYAISVSSPAYFDVVYGLNSWEWNVYTDGLYAYAFPTFSNRLWWDWRFNSYGWGWYSPYYSWGWHDPFFSWSWYSGWYGYDYWHGCYGPHFAYHHYHHPHHGWGPSWAPARPWGGAYTARPSVGTRVSASRAGSYRPGMASRRSVTRSAGTQGSRRVTAGSSTRQTGTSTRSQGTSSTRRVVGTRQVESSSRSGATTRTGNASSSRRQTYTRPSSTRVTGATETQQGGSVRRSTATGSSTRATGSSARSGATGSSTRSTATSGESRATYSRGSSTSPQRREQGTAATRSSQSGTQSRSYNGGSSSRSGSSFSSGSSTRSSGGGAVRSSGGGGSRRR